MVALKNNLFLRILMMGTLMGPGIYPPAFADQVRGNPHRNFCSGFIKRIVGTFRGEDLYQPSYFYFSDVLVDATRFIETKNTGIELSGFNAKMMKLQELALKRYAQKIDPQAIHAFGVSDAFRMSNGTMKASVTLKKTGNHLGVEVANIGVKSIGREGNISASLDVSLAQFLASLRKGLEYRLSLHPEISTLEITAKDVMNVKLQKMLQELDFEKMPGAIPEWEPIKGFEGTNAPTDFKIRPKVIRH